MSVFKKTYVLKLYVAGNTPNSVRALKTLKNILEEEFQGATLAKVLPPPVRKIIGDLSDREKVLIGLDLLYEEIRERENDS